MLWGRGQGLGGVANAVMACQRPWGRGQIRGAGQGFGGVAKAVEAWSKLWRHGQGRRGVAKAVGS